MAIGGIGVATSRDHWATDLRGSGGLGADLGGRDSFGSGLCREVLQLHEDDVRRGVADVLTVMLLGSEPAG